MIPTIHDTSLQMLGTLDTASGIGYTLNLNDLSTGSFTLAAEDPANGLCMPGSFVHMYDGDRDLGWWRISGMPNGNGLPGGTNQYNIEHAAATLMDDIIAVSSKGTRTWSSKTLGAILSSIMGMQSVTRWAITDNDFEDTEIEEYSPDNVTLLAGIKELLGML